MVNKIKNNYIYLFIGVLCSIIFSMIKFIGDDTVNTSSQFLKTSIMSTVIKGYHTWSSRIMINYIMYHVEKFCSEYGVYIFGILTGILIFISLKTLDDIFNEKNTNIMKFIILGVVLIYPFNILSSAGWIATMTTYYWPLVFFYVAIKPVFYYLNNKKINKKLYFFATLGIIYSANNEQMMIGLFILYTTVIVYMVITKFKIHVYVYIQYFLVIISGIFIMTTPGNSVRKTLEIGTWMPSFVMMNNIDKFQLGYTSTITGLLTIPSVEVILLSILLIIIAFAERKNIFEKILASVPLLICSFFGLPSNIWLKLYPNLDNINKSVTDGTFMYGLIDFSNYFDKNIFVEYIILGIFTLSLFTSIVIMISNRNYKVLGGALFVGGMLSRILMGFSPTIWASGDRTYGFLYGCISIIIIILMKDFVDSSKSKNKDAIAVAVVLVAFVNILSLSLQIIN
ncbi:hypothetical protein QYC42_01075 [Ligilactobacillus salivarius]|uniref:hypothetical protein n=1 Tax=Ligilactobacillus salivarius TaxID=1624 RepID=UPI00263A510E|nr:hypothetical protein [Ligilactobacillus salivarius]MDN4847564.1 hypothetical protein [Ligilactobacillus salivarius]